MSKSNFDEEQLKKLLKELPKISDNRDPKDVYHQIQSKKKKYHKLLVPGIISTAAAIILLLILPLGLSLWKNDSSTQLSFDSEELAKNENNMSLRMAEDKKGIEESDSKAGNEALEKTVLYKENLAGNELLVYGIPDHEGPYFLLYTENQERPFFVEIQGTGDSPEAAFLEMQKDIPTHGLTASIPDDFQIEKVLPDDRNLIIYVKKGSSFPENKEIMYALEGILLTAKDFGFETVEIKDAASENIGPFSLTKVIDVP
jgi:hypothetical protein